MRQEAQLGYDLRIGFPGFPIFIQFKIAEGLTRPRSKYWQNYGQPYFRFDVYSRKRSSQHDMLKKLAGSEPEVNYIAPIFWKNSDFSRYYASNEILANSICVPLRELGYLPDDDSHQITFVNPYRFDWHSSDDLARDGDFSGVQLARRILGRFEQRELRQINEGYIEELHSILIGIIQPESQFENVDRDVPSDINLIPANISGVRFLLTNYFGVEFLLLRDLASQG